MDKGLVRTQLLAKRRLIQSTSFYDLRSAISRCVDWQNVSTVHVYVSNDTLGEIDTLHIVGWLQHTYPAVRIIQPDFRPDAPLYSGDVDVIIVPVVGFDACGNRIGMGGGWYDKFLATQPYAIKIGLAYDECEVQKIEPEPHDVRLDFIATPTRLIDAHELE